LLAPVFEELISTEWRGSDLLAQILHWYISDKDLCIDVYFVMIFLVFFWALLSGQFPPTEIFISVLSPRTTQPVDHWLLFVPFPIPGWMTVDRQRKHASTYRPCGICASLLQFLCWSADGWGSSAALHVTRNLFLSSSSSFRSQHFRTAGEVYLTMMRPALCYSPGIKASGKRDSILRCFQRLGCSRVQWTQRRFKLL